MRILVDPSGYHCLNMGDVAMLQVTVSRLRALWPETSIEVISDAPELIASWNYNVTPLLASGRREWFQDKYLLGRFHDVLPSRVSQCLLKLEKAVRRKWPSLTEATIRLRMRVKGSNCYNLTAYLDAVNTADLVVASGGGYITDSFKNHAIRVLDTLGMAARRGKPTVMFGQGLGPINDPELLSRAKAILPLVNLIAVRESRASVPLTNSLGIDRDQVIITGDDAIEMAYANRNVELGDNLGVNIRVATYSEVDQSVLYTVRSVLHDIQRKLGIRLLPIPISRSSRSSDISSIQKLVSNEGGEAVDGSDLDTPLKVIRQAGQCRVIVTGSYHAAVFGLSQGVPAVCMVKSAYYADKFLGLAGQFGEGCEVIFLNEPNLKVKLATAVETMWNSAERFRTSLLDAAARQVKSSKAAYDKAYNIAMS